MADRDLFTSLSPALRVQGISRMDESQLRSGMYLVLLFANRIPPHLVLTINGKLFTLGISGATVDAELDVLLTLIRRKKAETLFFPLKMPNLFTPEQLRAEIKKFTLAYPRVDVGIATCLSPIRDFCGSVYDPGMTRVNFVYELLPKLRESGVVSECYHMNMEPWLNQGVWELRKYSMNDIYEGIRKVQAL